MAASTPEETIVPYGPEHYPATRDFLRDAYPAAPLKADERYLAWRYRESPLFRLPGSQLLAYRGDRLIGHVGATPDRLLVCGEWRDCVWLNDLFIREDERGGLTNLRLFQAEMRANDLILVVGAGPNMLKLYQGLRWKRFRPLETFYLCVRPGRLLGAFRAPEERERKPIWKAAALGAMDGALSIGWHAWAAAPRSSGGRVIESPSRFPEETDGFLASLVPALGCASWRDLELLRWKFERRPFGRHTLDVARHSAQGPMAGYMVSRPMEHAGGVRWVEIADYAAFPEDTTTFRSLLAAAVRRAVGGGADFVRIRLSEPEHIAVLKRPAWVRKTAPVSDEVFAWSRDKGLLDGLESARWSLTGIISDRSDYGADEAMPKDW